MKFRISVILILILVLSACGRTSRLPPLKPTPLQEISVQVNLNLKWSKTVSTSKDSQFLTLLPIRSADRIFVATQSGLIAAISKDDGQTLWTASVESGVTSGVGEAQGVVVVVDGELNAVALDSLSGEHRWTTPLGKVIYTPPLVYRGKALFKTIDGNLLAVDADSGEQQWEAFYDQPEFVSIGSPRPLGHGDSVVVGNADGRIIATDLASGFENWQIFLASERTIGLINEADTIPVIADNKLYVSDSPKAVVAYSLETGGLLWQHRRAADRWVGVNRNSVFGFDEDDTVFALNVENGTLMWEQKAFVHRKLTTLIVVQGYVIVTDSEGYLHLLDSLTGNVVGRTRIGEGLKFAGLSSDQTEIYAYFKSGAVKVYTLERMQ